MSYKLLVEKLYRNLDKKYMTREEIKTFLKPLKLDYYSAIRYLLENGYVIRILRGIFYVKSIEERKLKKIDISYEEAVSKALELKKIKNWYFGLESALKLNNLTHEYIAVNTIISDGMFRNKPIKIFGYPVKFLKIKKELFSFGIKKYPFPHSDREKTILDIIYFARYNGKNEIEIKNKIKEYKEHINKKRILEYSRNYPRSVKKIIEEIL